MDGPRYYNNMNENGVVTDMIPIFFSLNLFYMWKFGHSSKYKSNIFGQPDVRQLPWYDPNFNLNVHMFEG